VANADDKDGILGAQPDEHYKPNLGVNVVLHLDHVRRHVKADYESDKPQSCARAAEYRNGSTQQDAEGQDVQLS